MRTKTDSQKLSRYKELVHSISTQWDSTFDEKNLEVPLKHFFTGEQVHSDRIAMIKNQKKYRKNIIPKTDALITPLAGIFLGVKSADCAPILLYDPVQKIIATVHSGWRGTLLHINKKVIQRMEKDFSSKAKDVIVYIGPMIKKECYEISKTTDGRISAFQKAFPKTKILIRKRKRIYLDLLAAIHSDLLSSRIKKENIEVSPYCTVCRNDLFPSHRVEGKERREVILSVIGKKIL